MAERRPDPDRLLAEVRSAEARAGQGRLKVFFGASPGVGKTYAMLEAARARRAEGADVVAGLVETHGRLETGRLLEGLDVLPRRPVAYRGTTLLEFDLDGALARKPALLLVDELAHTNAAGSRHAKRWQDVEELLAAGIDVYTTVNVQHVESLNDVVAQITGVAVRETVPDAVLERADEIELVDVTADVLLQRLREGKVYLPEAAARAVDRFFRRGNLIALRELALRRTAEQVDAQMLGYRRIEGIREIWPTTERLLVCVGPAPACARVVRSAARLAASLRAPWVAAYVRTPQHDRLTPEDRDLVAQHLRLAEELGGEAATLTGTSVADELLAFSRERNVTKLVVGKPAGGPLRTRRRGLVDELVKRSGEADVWVITGEGAPAIARPAAPPPRAAWPEYAKAAGLVALAAALCLPLRAHLKTIDVAMVFLLAVVAAAARHPRGPSVAAALLAIGAFDFWFVPPYGTFSVADARYGLTFVVMLVTGLVMGGLTARIRWQAEAARERERRTAALLALSGDLASGRDAAVLAAATARHAAAAVSGEAAVALTGATGELEWPAAGFLADEKERSVARWVAERGQPAGAGSDTLPGARARYLPLATAGGVVGVLGVCPTEPHRLGDPDSLRLIEAMADQAALALERARLAESTHRARLEVEAERLRTSLLSALSHDLRTPLGAIEGAASSLLGDPAVRDDARLNVLADTILGESRRMTHLTGNLLDMVRLESGALNVQKEWVPLEEVIGVARIRTEDRLQGRQVTTRLPPELLLVPVDPLLLEQVLINLLENAARYTPPGTPVDISASMVNGDALVEVADRGPGLPPGGEAVIFEKFQRGGGTGAGGIGLGLTICRGIVRAHGGRIWAENRLGGGAAFRFTLPLGEGPPPPPEEAAGSGAEAS